MLQCFQLIVELMPLSLIVNIDDLDSKRHPRLVMDCLLDNTPIAKAKVFSVGDILWLYRIYPLTCLVVS
jgi:hypothetical protein